MDILSKLESKWGNFIVHGHALCNKPMPFVSSKAFLNILFAPNTECVQSSFDSLDAKPLPGLIEFYKKYNGCRLFSSSLNIFGVQLYRNDLYEPYDLFRENLNIQSKFKDDNYMFFASLGGDFVFAYRKDELCKIYAFKKGQKNLLKTYSTFLDWFNYYFNALFEEYDTEGRKVHPNDVFKEIPVLYHETNEFF